MSLLTFKNSMNPDTQGIGNSVSNSVSKSGAEDIRKSALKSSVSNPLKNSLKNTIKNDDKKPSFGRFNNRGTRENTRQNQIISGYFIKEKSYKEMVISRINNFLCGVLALLVMVCLVSYYFVINGEIQLNSIRKETLAINYENEDMQHRLDIYQSFSNVDREVTRTKILQTAKQVMELSAANLPSVNYENKNVSPAPGWSLGY